jgi:N-acetylglucosaminyl-diphospho-decaprenol L-rhamnosyltransferase
MTLSPPDTAKLVIIIVSYGNPDDVERCLNSLVRSGWTDFDVFICENAGNEAFSSLRKLLTRQNGPLQHIKSSDQLDEAGRRLAIVTKCRFRESPIVVRLALATENLGYAGGVNAWLERLLPCSDWEAVLVLNPDTSVAEACLSELMAKAAEGFGMVGASLVYDDTPDKIINYGLRWSRRTGRTVAVGRNSLLGNTPSDELLARIDAVSGACVLVTRAFINDVGLMAEEYFLYTEDLDWGRRRRQHKIGIAWRAVVRHIGGTSIGSATFSPLFAYLTCRNGILFARRSVGWLWILHFAIGLLYLGKVIIYGPSGSARASLAGLIDGARGKTGRPNMCRYPPVARE